MSGGVQICAVLDPETHEACETVAATRGITVTEVVQEIFDRRGESGRKGPECAASGAQRSEKRRFEINR